MAYTTDKKISRAKRRKAEETLRLLKASGAVSDDFTIEDLFDQLNIVDTEEDRVLEAEAVILFFNLKGEGFREHTCPVCNQKFASKYKITTSRFENLPKAHENMKPAQKEAISKEIEEIKEDQEEFTEKFGMKCSNSCRALALKEMGINWNPYKRPENRWSMAEATKGELPLIVPPPAYEIMVEEHNMKAAIS